MVGFIFNLDMDKTKKAQKLAKRVWGAEYQKMLKESGVAVVDKYSVADLELIKKHFKLEPETKFLEIGCGRGRVSAMLSQLGVDVSGLDISPEAIALAKKIFRRNKLKGSFVCGDIENIPFENEAFDFVFGGGVLEHLEDTQRAFNEIFRVLKRGGKLVTTIPCLSLTTLFQGLLTGSIPQVPVIKQLYLFIHQNLLRNRYMMYGYEKLYTLGDIEKLAEGAGFKHIIIEPYLPGYDFKFIPTKVLKGLASRLVRIRGFWPMIGFVVEK